MKKISNPYESTISKFQIKKGVCESQSCQHGLLVHLSFLVRLLA